MAKSNWTPPLKVREYLVNWPAGEERPATDLVEKADMRFPAHKTSSGKRAVAEGYIVKARTVKVYSGPYLVDMDMYVRTDKALKAYVPRGPVRNPVKRPYIGIYPWSVDEHWTRMEASPARI